MVAEKFSHLVKEIAAEGHEIASHGYNHIPLCELTPAEFAKDLHDSLALLNNLSPRPVQGYRAPDFSINKDTLWALDILREQGIRYDSSIFPFRGRRYGFSDVLLKPYQILDDLIEVPLSVIRLAGHNWPVAGGGYFRLLPYWVTRWAIRCINTEKRPAVMYLHPYELNTTEMQQFKDRMPWHLYWSQSLNRCRTECKLCSLLRDFRFAPIRRIIGL
jgi:polysaccharide deacetylase family protein (PEP-CTERM system associated)